MMARYSDSEVDDHVTNTAWTTTTLTELMVKARCMIECLDYCCATLLTMRAGDEIPSWRAMSSVGMSSMSKAMTARAPCRGLAVPAGLAGPGLSGPRALVRGQ